MANAGRDWQMFLYGGAKHGFSDPNAAQHSMKDFEYNEAANRRSWRQEGFSLRKYFRFLMTDPQTTRIQ